jgi:DNA mismatch endonuclease, patch repair protein
MRGQVILDSMGLRYKSEVLLANKFVVDILLTDTKIVIQWDGDYWHGYQGDSGEKPISDRQMRRARLDRSQDAYLKTCGYMVLRFWEHDVVKNSEVVIEYITRAIRSIAA